MKNIFGKNCLLMTVYIVVNVLLGGLFLTAIPALVIALLRLMNDSVKFDFIGTFAWTLAISAVVTFLMLLVSLSPLGDWFLLIKYKARKLKGSGEPLAGYRREVLDRAQALDAGLNEKIRLYVTQSPETNALALSHRAIVVTSGLLDFDPEKAKALIAREMGHISQGDTDFVRMLSAGNVVTGACAWVLRIGLYLATIPILIPALLIWAMGKLLFLSTLILGISEFAVVGWIVRGICGLAPALWKLIFKLAHKISWWVGSFWSAAGTRMVMKSRQVFEYDADAFAGACGYGEVLCDLIENDDLTDESQGMFRSVVMAYPPAYERIARLQSLEQTIR